MSETVSSIRVLHIEDDPGIARLVEKRLKRLHFEVSTAYDGESGLQKLQDAHFDIMVMDLQMPGMDGLQVLERLKTLAPHPPVIMLTGTGNEKAAVQALKLGAADYIVKDIGGGYLDLLPTVIEQALQQRALEEEKRRIEEEQLRLIAELDAFAHTVAHDLKTPLATIIGYAGLLADSTAEDAESQQEFAETIRKTAYKMNSIIEELLLLASVRNEQDIKVYELDMGMIVAAAIQRHEMQIRERKAQISLPQNWPVAMGHAPWIEEVWSNYISNAIKYGGEPPQIDIGAEQEKSHVRFYVRDNGPGLDMQARSRLFAAGTRLAQHRALKGHGLGLSIVRRIVERLGGEVGVESEPGHGSTFYFTLPIAQH